MIDCPNPSDKLNCALIATQDLIDRKIISIDVDKLALGEDALRIGNEGSSAHDVFRERIVRVEGSTAIADLGCLTCGRCVQIVDKHGDMSVRVPE